MVDRRRERGLTLIEILLSLIVMVVGVIGILALFPPALQSSQESVHETQTAIQAESVAHAFKNAIQVGQWDATTLEWTVLLTHDLKTPGGEGVKYQFKLPKLPPPPPPPLNWFHHPGGAVATGNPENEPFFEFGGDGWIHATVETIRDPVNGTDPSEPYKQFGFSFDVAKIPTLSYLWPATGIVPPPINPATGLAWTQNEVEQMSKLYEFRIHIFRLVRQVTGTTSGPIPAQPRLIHTLTDRVSTR
jgi:hypothetical protein